MKICARGRRGLCLSPREERDRVLTAVRQDGEPLIDLCAPCLDFVARVLAEQGRRDGRLDPDWRIRQRVSYAVLPFKILSSKPWEP